jgi:hypothetical protein
MDVVEHAGCMLEVETVGRKNSGDSATNVGGDRCLLQENVSPVHSIAALAVMGAKAGDLSI